MCNPIIKWVGGKRQLLPIITEMMPKQFNTYYEPFFGGGAVFFAISPEKAVINDFNPQLAGMYEALRDNTDEVKSQLDKFQENYNSLSTDEEKTAYYYDLRDRFNCKICKEITDAEAAALLIFLNKAGFNGLYRISKAGKYNVPPAHKKTVSAYSEDNLMAAAEALAHADICCGDFADAIVNAAAGDFVFIDSPYYDTFDSYQAGGFSEEDHRRLAKLFDDLSRRGVKCMLTNSNTDFIKDLYSAYNIRVVPVKRMVNSDASKRTGEEVIITNYIKEEGENHA